MNANCEKSEPAVINETLQQLDRKGTLTASKLSHLLGLASTSAYRYFKDTPLRHDQLRLLIQHGGADVGAALLASLTSGTPHQHIYIDDDLDIDGDGDVDNQDATGHLLKSLEALSDEMRLIHGGESPDMTHFAELADRVMRGVVNAERTIAHIASTKPTRRKAKTPGSTGGVR